MPCRNALINLWYPFFATMIHIFRFLALLFFLIPCTVCPQIFFSGLLIFLLVLFFSEAYLIKALLSPLRSVGVWCTWAFQVSKDV